MEAELEAAKKHAASYRYTGDRPQRTAGPMSAEVISRTNRFLLSNGLHVTQETTPSIYESLNRACENLGIGSGMIHAYVTHSPDLQAECFRSSDKVCILRISSSLVENLSTEELTFVFGHEIGHFLYEHHIESGGTDVESLLGARAKEISVDRVGLVACQSLETAIKAIIKVLSGLTDEHLRFDAAHFLNQLRASDASGSNDSEAGSTHPSLLLRARALLWFSMNNQIPLAGKTGGMSLQKIEEKIKRDLDKYVDGPARKRILEAEKDLFFWLSVHQATQDGQLRKKEKDALIETFGEEVVSKLIALVSDMSVSDVQEYISQNLHEAVSVMRSLASSSIDERLGTLQTKAAKLFA